MRKRKMFLFLLIFIISFINKVFHICYGYERNQSVFHNGPTVMSVDLQCNFINSMDFSTHDLLLKKSLNSTSMN